MGTAGGSSLELSIWLFQSEMGLGLVGLSISKSEWSLNMDLRASGSDMMIEGYVLKAVWMMIVVWKMEIHGRIGVSVKYGDKCRVGSWMLFCAKLMCDSMLACFGRSVLIFLDCIYGPLPWRCHWPCGWMSPIFFSWSCLQSLGHHRTHSFFVSSSGSMLSPSSPRPLCWPVPLIPTCWPAADLANASSLIKDTHMCNCQSHPCHIGRVQSHQFLSTYRSSHLLAF